MTRTCCSARSRERRPGPGPGRESVSRPDREPSVIVPDGHRDAGLERRCGRCTRWCRLPRRAPAHGQRHVGSPTPRGDRPAPAVDVLRRMGPRNASRSSSDGVSGKLPLRLQVGHEPPRPSPRPQRPRRSAARADDNDPGHGDRRPGVELPERRPAPRADRNTIPCHTPGSVRSETKLPRTRDDVDAFQGVRAGSRRLSSRTGGVTGSPVTTSTPRDPGGTGNTKERAWAATRLSAAGIGHRPAAERAHVVGTEIGVTHAPGGTLSRGTRSSSATRGAARCGCPGPRRPCR